MAFQLRPSVLILTTLFVLAVPATLAVDYEWTELNYYEWTAVAPVVVSGTSLGENGRYTEFRVRHALRGDIEPDQVLRIDLKRANRERRRSNFPFALKMPAESEYLLVLENPRPAKDGQPAFQLARGVRSVREIPLESQRGIIDAVTLFLEIQNYKDDRMTWRRMGAMLEESNPIVIATALEQMFKFRRGTLEQLFSVRPLLDHPDAGIREDAARLSGQIIARHGSEDVPEKEAVMAELIGVARRDEMVGSRVAATEALAAFGIARVETVLDEIAASDPDQNVRFQAEKLLLEYRREQQAEAARPRLGGTD